MGYPVIRLTPTLPPRLFPCLHCEHLSPVSSFTTFCPGSREPLSHSCLLCGFSPEAILHIFTGLLDHYILPTLQSAPKANWARPSTLRWWVSRWGGSLETHSTISEEVTPVCKGTCTALWVIKSTCVPFYRKVIKVWLILIVRSLREYQKPILNSRFFCFWIHSFFSVSVPLPFLFAELTNTHNTSYYKLTPSAPCVIICPKRNLACSY